MPSRRAWPSLVTALVLLALGALVATGVGQALGLSHTPTVAPPGVPASSGHVAAITAAPAIERIDVPAGERLALGAQAVSDALAGRGMPRPSVGTGTAGAELTVRIAEPFSGSAEAYRLTAGPGGWSLEAADVAGAAAGLYAVADHIRSGAPVVPAGTDGVVQSPRLGLRLTDAGSVGREPDRAAFAAGTDYSLNTDVVAEAALPSAPWVDQAVVDRIDAQLRQLVEHSLEQGYNGLVVPGFLQYVTFRGVGDGHSVYPPGDPHVARAEAMVRAFAPVFRRAHDLGMHVYFLTDMLAVDPPLEHYLDRTYGGLRVDDPALWSVYQAGLDELFDAMPFLDGLMIRVGEGGADYQAGWDYSSKLAVTSAVSVRAMLHALLATAGAHDKDVIFRSWTVGVGPVGDLHTNPTSYDQVLGDLDDPHLVVSTKYTAGDFYSHLPLNPTLETGSQRRIVEFQGRREFEGFGALPNDLVAQERQALEHFLAVNPQVEGVWEWTQDGGPLKAGPMTLYLRTGFWQLYDVNTYGVGRLAWDPDVDATQVTTDWVRQTLSDDPATVAAITTALAQSRDAIERGLYIAPFAGQTVRALGLEPPPMMWIFEWDIVTGDSAALDSIYAVSRGQVDAAIADGDRAARVADAMRSQVARTDGSTWRSPELRGQLVAALEYETNLLQTLAAYRATVLRHAQWLDTGSATAYDQWRAAERTYRAARAEHVAQYAGDVDLPAYNFTAADLGTTRADRDPAMAWTARGLLVGLLVALALGTRAGGRLLRGRAGAGALRALLVGATRPWRLADAPTARTRTDRVVVWLLPAAVLVLSRATLTWFAAPAHLLVSLGGWALFAGVLRLLVGRRDPFHLWAALGGVALLRSALLLGALALRGPGRYWFGFWAAPDARSAYITVAFAGFGWLFVVAASVLRTRYGLLRRRAVGVTAVAAGAALAVLAGLVGVVGLERALTIWNDQLALLPWGLSRILGITVYLGIPTALPEVATATGLALAAVGIALVVPPRRRPATSAETADATLTTALR